MPRVKRGPKRKNRRVRVLELAKGYYGTKHNCFRIAELQVERSLVYATRDRKQKKREFRGLWIVRINAAARQHDLSYSKLMAGLKKAGSDVNRKVLAEIAVDRKVLAEIAVEDPKGFANIVASAKSALGLTATASASA
jgi:large subunit ribosomal protein L20